MSIISKMRAPVNPHGRHGTWLDACLARGKSEFFVEVVDVTPALAQQMLLRNTKKQRSIRDKVVEGYALAMTEGRWKLTAQGISFDKDGDLDNGQHRLHAVIKSGVTVKMTVTFGHDAEAYLLLDSGSPRKASDALRTAGVATEAIAPSIITRVATLAEGHYTRRVKWGYDEIVELAATDPYLRRAIAVGHNLGRALKSTDTGFGLGAYYIIASKHPTEVKEGFFDKIRSGMIAGPRDPVRYLREKAMKSGYRGAASIYVAAAEMIIAFNMNLAKKAGKPEWDYDQPFPVVAD